MMLASTASDSWREEAVAKEENRKKKGRYVARSLFVTVLVAMSVMIVVFDVSTESKMKNLAVETAVSLANKINKKDEVFRRLSIDFGDGTCEWTQAVSMGDDEDAGYHTLITSFPGSGMRFTWQQTEGMTGSVVGDEFDFNGDSGAGVAKSHYPHPEGQWIEGHDIDQVALLVRNPRWALVSYHAVVWELGYSYDLEKSREMIGEYPLFTRRPSVQEWTEWRDFWFEGELDLWVKHINFWMSNGIQYWNVLDYERTGEYPFSLFDPDLLTSDSEDEKEQDEHCAEMEECKPKTVVVYEKLRQESTGPGELEKLHGILLGKGSMENIVSEEALPCIWSETVDNVENTDGKGRPGNRNLYKYTIDQMEKIVDTVDNLRTKYSTAPWTDDPRAHELLTALDIYHNKNTHELNQMLANPPAPVPHGPDYKERLAKRWEETGKLNRYRRDKVEGLKEYWKKAGSFFDKKDNEAITRR